MEEAYKPTGPNTGHFAWRWQSRRYRLPRWGTWKQNIRLKGSLTAFIYAHTQSTPVISRQLGTNVSQVRGKWFSLSRASIWRSGLTTQRMRGDVHTLKPRGLLLPDNILSNNKYTYVSAFPTHINITAVTKSQQTTLSFNNFANKVVKYYVRVGNTWLILCWYHPTLAPHYARKQKCSARSSRLNQSCKSKLFTVFGMRNEISTAALFGGLLLAVTSRAPRICDGRHWFWQWEIE